MHSFRYTRVTSPIGELLIVADHADRLRGVYLPGHKHQEPYGRADAGGIIQVAAIQLAEYFAGVRATFSLPFGAAGSPFQERVWAALRDVPYATTTTYGRIAAELGMGSGAARAIGAANARNPFAIIVPCHRVLGVSGSLTGYAGGLAAKRLLLDHEARVARGSGLPFISLSASAVPA